MIMIRLDLRALGGLFIALTVGHSAVSAEAVAVSARQSQNPYYVTGLTTLDQALALQPNTGKAKNVILFIGDGMGISTIVASRIYDGQSRGVDGESSSLSFEKLPYLALSKTYSVDTMVTDSAASASGIMTGVKTGNGMIGVDGSVVRGDCTSSKTATVTNLAELARSKGRSTGAVTTTAVTDATPASTYAHVAQRDWEVDANMPAAAKAAGCTDIARQMMEWPHGDGLEVMLGGGRQHFIPATMADPEYADKKGKRADGKNLAASWSAANPKGAYVWNRDGFAAVDPKKTTKLLGLFEPSHMQFEADRTAAGNKEPSLAEMTTKAIAMLSKNQKGYVLMVEAGRIDHAHHGGNARRALQDTVALNTALKAAMDQVDLRDTLIVVTSDHSHVFTIAGYPERGNPILGVVSAPIGTPTLAMDGKGYTTLGYANGPGAVNAAERPDPAKMDTEALNYRQQSLIPLMSETHGGDDVVARAAGPKAHLFKGTIEQNTIFQIMRAALGFN
jgi:alkaline phosphatase